MCTPENSGDNCDDANTIPPIIIPPVENSCPLPDALNDTTAETVNPAPTGEQNLQVILDTYTQNAQTDQKQYQVWNVAADSEVVIDATFVNKFATYSSVFGYYTDSSMSNFVPVFKTTNIAGYESTPLASAGPFTVNTGEATTIGFAIKVFNGTESAGNFATENSLNTGSADQVLVYNPSSNTFVLAFEDIIGGDNDFNDLVVEVELNCEELEEPTNTAPLADAGPDQIITLPTSTTNLNGTGTDTDGTISSFVWDFVSGPSTINPNDVEDPSTSPLVAGTYVFKLTVTDNDGATDDDTVTITVNPQVSGPAQCNDDVDNADAEDTLADELDPGCHTDGNANNSGSYNPNDNDETNVVTTTECSDGVDNSDDEDSLVDMEDSGCDDSTDDNETNLGDSGGGGSSSRRRNSTGGGEVLGAETSCGIYVEKYLRVGYNNNVEAVKKVQIFLNNYMNAGLVVDGIYGLRTEAAVKAFQFAHKDKILTPWGISAPTGIFYITTQIEVNNIMCPTLNIPIPSNLMNFYPGATN